MKDKRTSMRWGGVLFLMQLMLFLIVPTVAPQMSSPHSCIPTSVLYTGGGLGASASFGVQNSTGQSTPIGISQSPSFTLRAGFQPTTLEELLCPTLVKCDINGDGQINVIDVLASVNHILNVEPLPTPFIFAADCDGDGDINILDVLGCVNVILGIGECDPIGF